MPFKAVLSAKDLWRLQTSIIGDDGGDFDAMYYILLNCCLIIWCTSAYVGIFCTFCSWTPFTRYGEICDRSARLYLSGLSWGLILASSSSVLTDSDNIAIRICTRVMRLSVAFCLFHWRFSYVRLAENVNKPHPFQLFVLEPDGLLLSLFGACLFSLALMIRFAPLQLQRVNRESRRCR